ncbi:hypothetical protein F5Y11DRAFT_362960 [Daldinia sp. FL1419]|nr:hypothetical protein F5Y11DRAFT_362960 [Daldinia sp. FL1419]
MEFQPQYPPTQLHSQSKSNDIRKVVRIFHPGYKPEYPLLELRATDDGSLCYTIIYHACCIIAGNIWDDSEGATGPYLSTSPDPSAQRYQPANYVIPAGAYYFHVPNTHRIDSDHTQPYPIIPEFQHWPFPDKPLPKPWRDLAADNPTVNTDSINDPIPVQCPITSQLIGLEDDHVMPKTTQPWLKMNKMRRFMATDTPIATHDAACNKIYFRHDFHHLWENNFVALVPKPSVPDGKYKLVSHLLAFPKKHVNANTEAHVLFHNRPCLPIPHVPVELLFVRFGWALFTNNLLKMFGDHVDGDLYSVLLLRRDEQGTRKLTQALLPLHEFPRVLSKATGVRGAGANKRNHSQIDEEVDEEVDEKNADLLRRNWIFSPRTGKIEPDSDSEYPVGHKRHARNWVFSTQIGQMEPDSNSDSNSDSDIDCGSNAANSNHKNEVQFDDDDDDMLPEIPSDVEHDPPALDSRTKPKLPYPPTNPDPIPDLSMSVASLGSSDCSLSQNRDSVSGMPIAAAIDGKDSKGGKGVHSRYQYRDSGHQLLR